MKPHIKDFFNFLEEKENKPIPLIAKLLNPKDYKIDPEDLNIKGDLWLSKTRITRLPDGLKVEGSLNLRKTPITQLPNNLQVGGNLSLRRTPISKTMSKEQIRKEILDKGGYVKGDIFLT